MRLDQLESGLRAEAQAVPAPDPVVGRRRVTSQVRRARVGRVIGIVLALLVPLAFLLVGHVLRGDSSEHVVTNPGQVPLLVPGFMSSQVRLSTVIELPAPPTQGDRVLGGRTWIYATGSANDSLGGSSFAVVVSRIDDTEATATTALPVGFVGYAPAVGSMRGAFFRVSPAVSFEVMSAQLSQAQLRTLGGSVRLGGPGAATLRHLDPPAGYHQVVAGADDDSTAEGMVLDTTARGYVVVWGSADLADNGVRALAISVTTAQPDQLDVVRWGLQSVTRVEVNGHPGYLGSQSGGERVQSTSSGHGGTVSAAPRAWVLAWFQDPTTLVIVQALGGLNDGTCATDCTPAVVEHIAASLAPASDSQWQAFRSAASSRASVGTLAPGCIEHTDHNETCTSSNPASGVPATTTTSGPGG